MLKTHKHKDNSKAQWYNLTGKYMVKNCRSPNTTKGNFMGLNLRKSKSLGKGIRVTFSKGGPSVSVGKPGARVSVSKDGARGTLGVPGSGASYTKQKSFKKSEGYKKVSKIIGWVSLVVLIIYIVYGYF